MKTLESKETRAEETRNGSAQFSFRLFADLVFEKAGRLMLSGFFVVRVTIQMVARQAPTHLVIRGAMSERIAGSMCPYSSSASDASASAGVRAGDTARRGDALAAARFCAAAARFAVCCSFAVGGGAGRGCLAR